MATVVINNEKKGTEIGFVLRMFLISSSPCFNPHLHVTASSQPLNVS